MDGVKGFDYSWCGHEVSGDSEGQREITKINLPSPTPELFTLLARGSLSSPADS